VDQIREEFDRIDIKDKKAMRRFFLRYSFFSTNDLALILDLSPRTILEYKRNCDLRRKGGPKQRPVYPRIPTDIELPENWDTPEWWRAHYPKYGMYILTKVTGLNYHTVRKRVSRYCGGIRSYREAMASDHPCCNEEWLREHYIERELGQKACARLAGVSDSTLRGWLVRFGIQVRGSYGGSVLGKVGSI